MTTATNRVEIRNANPANEFTGDCVIRALVTVTCDTYERIQFQLGRLAWQHDWRCARMSHSEAGDYITNNGSLPHVWHKLAEAYGMRVVDVRGDGICFDPDWLPRNCIISTHNHAVAIKDGTAVDTFDSVKRGTKKVQYILVDAMLYTDKEDDDVVYGIVAAQDKVRRLRRNAKAADARRAKKRELEAPREERRRERSVKEAVRKFHLDGGATLRIMF